MIPFEELCDALETYRRQRQLEADLNGEAPARMTPPQSFEVIEMNAGRDDNTNEIDVNAVDVLEEQPED
jgi:hypothetical protein